MRLHLLGSAAGGGVPQWNCGCGVCAAVRSVEHGIEARTESGLALQTEDGAWMLVNAGRDVARQIETCPALHPVTGTRQSPVRGVLLTDAELDHTAGLLAFRHASRTDIWATACVIDALHHDLPIDGILGGYTEVVWHDVPTGEPTPLSSEVLAIAIPLVARAPKYVEGASRGVWRVAYKFVNAVTGRSAVYAPCLAEWSREFDSALDDASCILLDGTYWSARCAPSTVEVMSHGPLIPRPEIVSATAPSHLPIDGAGGSLVRLASHRAAVKVYVHVNNTNPAIAPESPERRNLTAAGVELGQDGMTWEV